MSQQRRWWIAAILTTLLLPLGANAQTRITRQVIASGAVAAVSPTHAIVGTIGQTIIGRSTSSSHTGSLGFWYTYPFPGTSAVRDDYVTTGATSAVRVSPNPVVASAVITVELPISGTVQLSVFDRVGRERARLIDGFREAGTTTIELHARDLESGDYLLVLIAGGERTSHVMRVIK